MEQERDWQIKAPKGNDDYAKRKCLSCDKQFESQSKGNRICARCKQNNEDASGLPTIWQECMPVPDTIMQKQRSTFIKSFGDMTRPRIRKK